MEEQKKDAVFRHPPAPDSISGERTGDPPANNAARREPALFQAGETEESFIEVIDDALHPLDLSVQGAFLQNFLKCLASVDVSEDDSLNHWQEILRRRKELSARFNRAVSLRTAAVDYFGSAGLLRNPMLLEYGEFKRLRHSAATDPLTGFYNRRLFEDYLTRELNRASRYRAVFALLLIDLRSFKKANDIYGHSIGDEILRSAARACDETIRGSDYTFRIGGDEFALLLPQSDSRSAESLARRIAQRFEQYARALAPNARVGLDYGIAAFPSDGADRASLFNAADRNLYANKKSAYQQLGETPPPAEGRPRPRAEEATQKPDVGGKGTFAAAAATEPSIGSQEGAPSPPAKAPARRRHERLPVSGVGSLGLVRAGQWPELVRIMDISPGGVGLLVDQSVKLPEKFEARLNVPSWPPAGLTLRQIYACQASQGKMRVGCSFDV